MQNLPKITHAFTEKLIAITRSAGAEILAIYNAPETANIQLKFDKSPVTAADIAAHDLIARELQNLLAVPMISEEASLPHFSERKTWPVYWLIDPLDGTKEFIARSDEFTVNIALIVGAVPLLGVVHSPVTDETYLGLDKSIASDQHTRAEKYVAGVKISSLKTRSLAQRFTAQQPLEVLVSHRHGAHAAVALLDKLQVRCSVPLTSLRIGSSLKFCWIAEGRADFYPRLAPTSEWDTAAAQAVLVAAGGLVVDAISLAPLVYNSTDSILNNSFFALGDAAADWESLLS